MNRIYDVESDQLKCNFCTRYFKCSIHYANIQRYSLKACNECFSNFTYTVLHPTTYQIFRVFLLDVGITIPLENDRSQAKSDSSSLKMQIVQVKEDINNKISSYFEEKIKAMMKEMDRIKDNFIQSFQAIEKEYAEVVENSSSQKLQELRNMLERLKNYETPNILEQQGKLSSKNQKKIKDLSLKSSIKTSQEDKQNFSISRYNVAKSIKSKICGYEQSSGRLNTSRSKSKAFSKSRINKSIIKSIKLDQSIQLQPTNFQQKERSEVTRLLEERTNFQTYMSRQVVKQSNVCLKSEGSRNIVQSILQMKSKTAITNELIELIGADATKTNFACYLKSLKDYRQVKTVRMIRCSLVDADMDHLLNFLSESCEVETLIVTNNRLTELSIEALLAFKQRHPQSRLSNVYIGNNYINNLKSAAILRKQNNSQLSINI